MMICFNKVAVIGLVLLLAVPFSWLSAQVELDTVMQDTTGMIVKQIDPEFFF